MVVAVSAGQFVIPLPTEGLAAPSASIDVVDAGSSVQIIVAVAADQRVVACLAERLSAVSSCVQAVVALAAVKEVVASAAVQGVVAAIAVDGVVSAFAAKFVISGFERGVSPFGSAVDDVVLRRTDDDVASVGSNLSAISPSPFAQRQAPPRSLFSRRGRS